MRPAVLKGQPRSAAQCLLRSWSRCCTLYLHGICSLLPSLPPNKLTSNHLLAILRNSFKREVVYHDAENMVHGARKTQAPTPALTSRGYEITDKLLNFLEPHFLVLQ